MHVESYAGILGFMQDRIANGPATASGLNTFWLRVRGMDQWQLADAFVYFCEWAALEAAHNDEVGYFTVTYSYIVAGERYVGEFSDFASGLEPAYQRDEKIQIRYNPANPARSYYPKCRTRTNFSLVCIAIGAAAAVVVLILSY
jgi:hypothetical protein